MLNKFSTHNIANVVAVLLPWHRTACCYYLLDKLFKFKTLRYFLCQTLGTNPIYSFTEEMLEVRYKVASEEITPASKPAVE